METFFILIGIVIAAVAGFLFGQRSSNNSQEKSRLETELKEKKEELEAFRNKVTSHFEKTADLFNQVSDSYQSLYDHMATSSNQLCSSQTFQSLPHNNETEAHSQPSRTNKTNLDAQNMFDANRLYKAHDYRNQAEDVETEVQEPHVSKPAVPESAKVVDIDSVKDDKNMPPLDYAIKAKGVINHNSLENEGLKKSES